MGASNSSFYGTGRMFKAQKGEYFCVVAEEEAVRFFLFNECYKKMTIKEKSKIDKAGRLRTYKRIRVLLIVMIMIMLGLYYFIVFSE